MNRQPPSSLQTEETIGETIMGAIFSGQAHSLWQTTTPSSNCQTQKIQDSSSPYSPPQPEWARVRKTPRSLPPFMISSVAQSELYLLATPNWNLWNSLLPQLYRLHLSAEMYAWESWLQALDALSSWICTLHCRRRWKRRSHQCILLSVADQEDQCRHEQGVNLPMIGIGFLPCLLWYKLPTSNIQHPIECEWYLLIRSWGGTAWLAGHILL